MHLLLSIILADAELKAVSSSHIVLIEETKVTNHADPGEHCGCSKQDTADIIVGQVLQEQMQVATIR